MPSYTYKALNSLGEQATGSIEAGDLSAAINALHDQSLSVLSIKESRKSLGLSSLFKEILKQRSPSDLDKIHFFQQLEMMLKGGHTLMEALVLSAEMSTKKPLQNAIVDMIVRLQQGGATFASALAAQGKMFAPYVSRLVAVGERSGKLIDSIERVSTHMEQTSNIKKQFINSLIYPAFVLLAAISVFIGLAIYIVPQFVDIIEGSRPETLPAISKIMLGISKWITSYGIPLLVFLAFLAILAVMAYRLGFAKKTFDSILIRTPFVGTSLMNANMAEMGWTMSVLLQNEQSLVESLEFAAENASNTTISTSLSKARDALLEGRNLDFGLRQPFIPRIVRQMCAVGERSGELPSAAQSLGEYFQRESANRMTRLKAIMEPATILFVAGIVGFVYLSFFNAIISIGSGFGLY